MRGCLAWLLFDIVNLFSNGDGGAMVRLIGGDQSDNYKRPVVSPIWEWERQAAVFDDTIRAFLDRGEVEVEVEYEPVTEGAAYLQLAVARLGLDGTVEVRLDDHGHIILKKTT